jgi:hypothetical protein
LYPILYQLASLVLDKVQANPELFPRLPTSKNNKTKTIHAIGKIIAAKRYSQARSDIVRLPPGEVDSILANAAEYSAREDLFILSQTEVLSACHLHDGKMPESKKAVPEMEMEEGEEMAEEEMPLELPELEAAEEGEEYAEEVAEEEMEELEPLDLSALSDDELMAELKKRGLMAKL